MIKSTFVEDERIVNKRSRKTMIKSTFIED